MPTYELDMTGCECCEGQPCCGVGTGDLVGVMTNKTGACACLEDEVGMVVGVGTSYPTWGDDDVGSDCSNQFGITVRCQDDEWLLNATNIGVDIPATAVSCDPFEITWEGLDGSGVCDMPSPGGFDFTLTEPP